MIEYSQIYIFYIGDGDWTKLHVQNIFLYNKAWTASYLDIDLIVFCGSFSLNICSHLAIYFDNLIN